MQAVRSRARWRRAAPLFACAVAAAIAFAAWRGERRRWLAAIAGAACLFGCFATLERGVWIATVVGIVAVSLFTAQGRRWLLPGLLAASVAIGGALAASPSLSEKASARAGYERSVWDRKNQTSAGLRMLAAKPLFGFGLGRYKTDSLEYFRQPADYPMTGRVALDVVGDPEVVQPLHNLYLDYAVELGLVGLSLWLASLLWAVGGAIFVRGPAELRPWKLGLLAISVFLLVAHRGQPQSTAVHRAPAMDLGRSRHGERLRRGAPPILARRPARHRGDLRRLVSDRLPERDPADLLHHRRREGRHDQPPLLPGPAPADPDVGRQGAELLLRTRERHPLPAWPRSTASQAYETALRCPFRGARRGLARATRTYPRRQGVPERIQELVPDARFIYVVRDPIARTRLALPAPGRGRGRAPGR